MVLSAIKGLFSKETSSEELLQILTGIYENIDGHQTSTRYREENQISDKSLTYGEIKFKTFAEVIRLCGDASGKIFYDIGSGTGKPCIAASLMFDFAKTIGIEYVPDLYKLSLQAKEALKEHLDENISKKLDEKIQFINGDALEYDFSDGDIVFCNSTCFTLEFYEALLPKFAELKKGSYVINLTKSFTSPQFELIFESKELEYSWGKPTTRIYKKIA